MSRRCAGSGFYSQEGLSALLRTVFISFLLSTVVCGSASLHAGAQENVLIVTITGVESDLYPQVTVHIDVRTVGGLPVVGLGSENVWVTEGDQSLGAPVSVVGDTTQEIALVLAVDVSLDEAAMAEVQSAAGAFLETLRPRDQVAVLAFGNDVQLVRDFVEPRVALEAVSGLVAGGEYTNLNSAVVEAVAAAGQAQAADAFVIVLTDSTDNVGAVELEEATATADQAGVPVHIIGFGPKMSRPEASELATLATGGNAHRLSDARQSLPVLQTIDVLMRQAYGVTFVSQLVADGREHPFDLNVGISRSSGGQVRGSAQGRFTALPRTVDVHLLGVEDGQTVGGMVSLAVQADAPASVVSVEYSLDGEPLVRKTAAPYGYLWDSSTTESGAHTLTADVVDSAGNQGQDRLTVQVAAPVVVSPVLFADRRVLGEALPVEVQVTALEEIASVEVFFDGRLVERFGEDSVAPYRVTLDTTSYVAGNHVVTVRAVDRLGRMAEWGSEAVLVAPPTPTPIPTLTPTPVPVSWQEQYRAPVLGGAMLLAGAMAIALLAMIARGQRLRRRVVYHLALENEGNVAGCYRFRVDVPGSELTFRWLLDGVELDRLLEEEPAAVEEQQFSLPKTGNTVQSVGRKVRQAGTLGSGIADLVGTAAHLVPGSAGTSLRRVSNQVRAGRSRVARTRSMVSQTRSTVSQTVSKVSRPTKRSKSKRDRRPVPVSTWHLTPAVEPGETLTVDLVVTPKRLFREQRHTFRVISRSVEQPDLPPVIQEQRLSLPSVPLLYRLLPYLLVLGGAVAIMVLAIGWMGV